MGVRYFAIALLLSFTWVGSASAVGDFKCKVIEDKKLTETGKFADAPISYVDREFVIDRSSGKMIGTPTNQNAFGTPTLIHAGDDKWSLKAVTIYNDKSVEFLRVDTFVEGPQKPFLFVQVLGVASGVCEEF